MFAAESYGPLLTRSGLLAQETVDDWRAFQAQSVADENEHLQTSGRTIIADHSKLQDALAPAT